MSDVIGYIRERNHWITIGLVVILLCLIGTSIYGLNVGITKNVYSVGGLIINQYSVGSSEHVPTIQSSNGSTLLLLLLPIELAGIILVILALRVKASGNMNALVLTLSMAIFLIVTFLVMNSMLDVFR